MNRVLAIAAAALSLVLPSMGEVPRGTYVGSSKTTVKFLDPITNAVTATRQYSRKLTVKIAKPLAGETNPFNLKVAPGTVTPAPVVSDFYTASARFVTTGGGTELLEYWTLQDTATGFTGAFTDSHLPEGFAQDRIILPFIKPSGALKPYRFHDDRVSPVFQVKANATLTDLKLKLVFTGYGFVPNKAGVQFTTTINANKQ